MTGFWDNTTGAPEDAYTKTFADVLPNNTTALAKIISCKNKEFMGETYINIEWELVDGEFKNQHLFQKIQINDVKPEKALKARNMLKLLFIMFHVKPVDNNPPDDKLLSHLNDKIAGIKIQEWSMQRSDGSISHGNFVSEVHPSEHFTTATGKYRDFKFTSKGVESALTRNSSINYGKELNDDIPF